MRSKKYCISGAEGYHELHQALERDSKTIEYSAIQTIEKIDQMLDDNELLNLEIIQSLARESVVNVPNLMDNQESTKSHLVIKCNERLEVLVERVKHEIFSFTENAEKIHSLLDLNDDGTTQEIQSAWKKELIQMQGQMSASHMDILSYYRTRATIGIHIFKQPRISDHWEELVELDEDFFFELRMILYHLRLFHLRLHHIVSSWRQEF